MMLLEIMGLALEIDADVDTDAAMVVTKPSFCWLSTLLLSLLLHIIFFVAIFVIVIRIIVVVVNVDCMRVVLEFRRYFRKV